MNTEEKIEKLERYGETVELDSNITAAAKARVKELYGDKAKQSKRKGLKQLFWLVPATCIIAVIIGFSIYANQPRFLSIDDVKTEMIESVQVYNTENGTEYLYLDIENAMTSTEIAVSSTDGTFAFIKQSVVVMKQTSMDVLEFYAVPSNIICSTLDKFDIITTSQDYAGVKLYFEENLIDGVYITKARFEYKNAKYYFNIQSYEQNAVFEYVDTLLGNNG